MHALYYGTYKKSGCALYYGMEGAFSPFALVPFCLASRFVAEKYASGPHLGIGKIKMRSSWR